MPTNTKRQLYKNLLFYYLCVRGQVIEGVVVNSLAVFDARAVLVVRIDVTVWSF